MVYHPDHPERRTVYYDDECETCERTAKSLQKSTNISIAGASASGSEFIDKESLKREIHAMDEDGVMHKGFDAVILILRWHPQGKYVAPVLALPVIKQIGALVYRTIARNRYRFRKRV